MWKYKLYTFLGILNPKCLAGVISTFHLQIQSEDKLEWQCMTILWLKFNRIFL